jgi:hypothetical protein
LLHHPIELVAVGAFVVAILLVMLGIELGTSHLLGKHSATGAKLPALLL